MKKIILLLVFVALAIASCAKTKTANISAKNTTESANTVVVVNSAPNTNLSNQTTASETKSEVNSEMLKQIEAQQLETADPRKAAKQNSGNSNQAPKKSVPPGMQN